MTMRRFAKIVFAEITAIPPLWIAAWIVGAVVGAMLAGCSTAAQLVSVPAPVPVECREKTPSRPAMPSEVLRPGAGTLKARVSALMAEIELREGYEIRLLSALENCTRPIAPAGDRHGH